VINQLYQKSHALICRVRRQRPAGMPDSGDPGLHREVTTDLLPEASTGKLQGVSRRLNQTGRSVG
jgi:hypothetical protein